ncbi:hypothetical protein NCC49_005785 [Naganishia albida]|nr:hypothetical protein NCC49_005785 [Naganishia albida]
MLPYSASGTEDNQYRRDDLWEETNAQSNNEIRAALNEALEDLEQIKRCFQEDCFELQKHCAAWEAKFANVTNQIIDFYNENWLEQGTMELALDICTHCLDLEVPYRGIWDLCDRIRESLTPEQQYDDDHIADPESSDVEAPPNQGKPRNASTATGGIDDARYYSQGYQAVSGLAPNASRRLATHPSDDLIFDCES